jgi:hypothetical protein
MPKTESSLELLKPYLPEGSFDDATFYLIKYKVHLTVTRERIQNWAITGINI